MKRMKTRLLLILCLLIFCSCSETENKMQEDLPDETFQTDETDPTSADVMEKYREVLLGNSSFYEPGTAEDYNIAEIRSCLTDSEIEEVTVSSFTVIDLDDDGIEEVILWPAANGNEEWATQTFGCVILHSIGDKVYGYPRWYRMFYQVKTDGTFWSSGGAGNSGFGKYKFTEQEVVHERITYCETYTDENGQQQVRFIVNGLEATQEDYDLETDKQDAKPDVQKHRYTEENVKKYIS